MNSGARHFQAGGIAQVDAQKQEEAWQAIGAKRRRMRTRKSPPAARCPAHTVSYFTTGSLSALEAPKE